MGRNLIDNGGDGKGSIDAQGVSRTPFLAADPSEEHRFVE